MAGVDPSSWGAALEEAKGTWPGWPSGGPGRARSASPVTRSRAALSSDATDLAGQRPFAWSARTARRALGLAAVRLLVAGGARSPVEAVRARLEESLPLGP